MVVVVVKHCPNGRRLYSLNFVFHPSAGKSISDADAVVVYSRHAPLAASDM